MALPDSFYRRHDVVAIAKALLGKVLLTNFHGVRTAGIIVETEAYAGITDRASHAYGGRRTKRTEVMYLPGGIAYVYLCYGIHHMFNVVTHLQDTPHAVLIRAIEPIEGIATMIARRHKTKLTPALTSGPGSLSQALGITTALTGMPLTGDLCIEDRGIAYPDSDIACSPRIGVDYAGADAALPYRFYIIENPYVSKWKTANK